MHAFAFVAPAPQRLGRSRRRSDARRHDRLRSAAVHSATPKSQTVARHAAIESAAVRTVPSAILEHEKLVRTATRIVKEDRRVRLMHLGCRKVFDPAKSDIANSRFAPAKPHLVQRVQMQAGK